MHFSKAAKAIFLIVNHVVATHSPYRQSAGRLYGRGEATYDSSLVARADQEAAWARLKTFNIWDFKKDCQDNCRTDCPKGEVPDAADCSKCKKCGSGEKPDAEGKKCVKDNSKDKEKKFDETKKKKVQEYKPKGFEKWKKIYEREYKDKRDEEKRRKTRRMVRVLKQPPQDLA